MTTKVLIIEDNPNDLFEISKILIESPEIEPENVRHKENFEEARDDLESHATETDLVLLDLRIPTDHTRTNADKELGLKLLDVIHSLNNRQGAHMSVIIVSAEAFSDQHSQELYLQTYKGTLLGVANKDSLRAMLKANLKRFRRDPMRNLIAKLDVGVLDEYDILKDTTKTSLDRIKVARKIAIRLVKNELDYFNDAVGASDHLAGNLPALIDELRNRFNANPTTGRQDIKASLIKSDGGWGCFLWRGWHIDHLYALNKYRNEFEHEDEQPYAGISSSPNAWNPPTVVLDSLRNGMILVRIIEMMVVELLDWYLPWHEQVYVPWKASKMAGGRHVS